MREASSIQFKLMRNLRNKVHEWHTDGASIAVSAARFPQAPTHTFGRAVDGSTQATLDFDETSECLVGSFSSRSRSGGRSVRPE
jgi:hypothetical protein